jgi:hypothetical protein
MLFLEIELNNLVYNKFKCPKCSSIACNESDFQNEKKAPTLNPPTPSSHSYCSVGSDWLGIDLKATIICYWPTPKTGNQRIEECLHSRYGRIPNGPRDVVRIVLIFYHIILLGGVGAN